MLRHYQSKKHLLINPSRRHFYFNFNTYNEQAPQPDKFHRNIDFPLNIGFNLQEYFKLISEEIFTNKSKMGLIWRKRMLSTVDRIFVKFLKNHKK